MFALTVFPWARAMEPRLGACLCEKVVTASAGARAAVEQHLLHGERSRLSLEGSCRVQEVCWRAEGSAMPYLQVSRRRPGLLLCPTSPLAQTLLSSHGLR